MNLLLHLRLCLLQDCQLQGVPAQLVCCCQLLVQSDLLHLQQCLAGVLLQAQ
jgi:hypothetical protein